MEVGATWRTRMCTAAIILPGQRSMDYAITNGSATKSSCRYIDPQGIKKAARTDSCTPPPQSTGLPDERRNRAECRAGVETQAEHADLPAGRSVELDRPEPLR